MTRGARAAVLVAGLYLAAPPRARAFSDDLGPRSLAMGEGGRADAQATDALRLNPAGMSLATLYNFAADYQIVTKNGGQTLRVAAADSTSDFRLGGGVYYAYRTSSAAGVPRLGAHEVGLALSYPFADRVFIGATAKYFRIAGGAEVDGRSRHGGVTVDIGLAIRPTPTITIGVTGHNVRDLSTVEAPVGLGYGIALAPRPDFTLVVDAAHDFTTTDPSRGVRTTVGGGGEFLIQGAFVARAGGGYDGGTGAGFVSAGVAGISGVGALDASVRQDLSGDRKVTFVVVGLRLFVESPRPSSNESKFGPPSRSERSSDVK